MLLYFGDGRLGNQLFQYAFLKTVARDDEWIIAGNMKELLSICDIGHRRFVSISTSNQWIRRITKWIAIPLLRIVAKSFRVIGFICQEHSPIWKLPLPCYYRKNGLFPITFVESDFYQAAGLFAHEQLDICIKRRYVAEAEEILDSVCKNREPVFVHVRRGDYLNYRFMNVKGISLPRSYYERAIHSMCACCDPCVYIFVSDDPEFVEYCYADVQNKYVSYHTMGVDLALLSLCKYGICSNSSFAWWGAMFMKDRKRVIFPRYWFGWKERLLSHPGIYPKWAEVIDVEVSGLQHQV